MRLLSQTSATSPHYSGSSRHISTLPHLSARSATSPLSHTSPHFPPHLHSPTPLPAVRSAPSPQHLSAGVLPPPLCRPSLRDAGYCHSLSPRSRYCTTAAT